MQDELTPENVKKLRKKFQSAILAGLSPEELLKEYGKERILSAFKPGERLAGMKAEDLFLELGKDRILSVLRPKEKFSGMQPEDLLREFGKDRILSAIRPEERLSGLKPEERLAGMTIEELEEYIKRKKKAKK